jgi:hypothetical protein
MDVFQLAPNHVWKAAPGCRILVVDNGGVRCDIPHEWLVYSPRRNVLVFDRFPPDNRFILAISCKRLPPRIMTIPLDVILEELERSDDRRIVKRGSISRFRRWPLEVAWVQLRVVDEPAKREKFTRLCVARAEGTQALIMFDFRDGEEEEAEGAWNTVMDSLVVGDYISDPLTGRKRMHRG